MKIKLVKAKLKDWNRSLFGDSKEKQNNILSKIIRIDLVNG